MPDKHISDGAGLRDRSGHLREVGFPWMRLGIGAVLGTLTALGLMIGGIAYALWTEEPTRKGEYGDPFSGVDTFLWACMAILAAGFGLGVLVAWKTRN